MSDSYPPGTNDADIERAFGGEPPLNFNLSSGEGPAWSSPGDAEDWGEGRYVVALVQADGVPKEVARRPSLVQARVRRELIARGAGRRVAVVVWDSDDHERGDLSHSGDKEGER